MSEHSPQALLIRSQLTLAEHLLGVMVELTALKARVHRLEQAHVTRPRKLTLRRVLAMLRTIGTFLASKQGQALMALVVPAVTWLAKWVFGNS